MAKTVCTFSYRILSPKKGDRPFNAIVHIIPKNYSLDKDEWPLLSPQLMTEQEIDWHVEAYEADLEHVGRACEARLTPRQSKDT